MKTTTLLLPLLSGLVVSSCELTTLGAPRVQVVNSSDGLIDHVDVGSVTFRGSLSDCSGGCSTGFTDMSEGSHPVTVYQTATSSPVSVGSIGPLAAGLSYAVNIRSTSASYCAELWDRTGNTTPIFNEDATRVLVSSSCAGS